MQQEQEIKAQNRVLHNVTHGHAQSMCRAHANYLRMAVHTSLTHAALHAPVCL
jgi:hypothetical protein